MLLKGTAADGTAVQASVGDTLKMYGQIDRFNSIKKQGRNVEGSSTWQARAGVPQAPLDDLQGFRPALSRKELPEQTTTAQKDYLDYQVGALWDSGAVVETPRCKVDVSSSAGGWYYERRVA